MIATNWHQVQISRGRSNRVTSRDALPPRVLRRVPSATFCSALRTTLMIQYLHPMSPPFSSIFALSLLNFCFLFVAFPTLTFCLSGRRGHIEMHLLLLSKSSVASSSSLWIPDGTKSLIYHVKNAWSCYQISILILLIYYTKLKLYFVPCNARGDVHNITM